MSRPPDDELPSEVRALLDHERAIPAQPTAVRARMLARARAALAAGGVSREGPSKAPRRVRWAAAAALVCLASAAAVAAAYRLGVRAKRRVEPSVAVTPPPAPPPGPASAPARPAANVAAAPPAAHAPLPPPPPSPSRADVNQGELRLLRLARAAVAREDFAAALRPLAEHRRRFKDGRLAEEREALRVRALAGLGRTEEALRAAAEFEARFPRSVLLPTVGRVRGPAP